MIPVLGVGCLTDAQDILLVWFFGLGHVVAGPAPTPKPVAIATRTRQSGNANGHSGGFQYIAPMATPYVSPKSVITMMALLGRANTSRPATSM